MIMKFKLGIMSNTWKCKAENADIAVATLMLSQQTSSPIAIYEPENERSRFSMLGVKKSDDKLKEFTDFLEKNKDEIRSCFKTLIPSPKNL